VWALLLVGCTSSSEPGAGAVILASSPVGTPGGGVFVLTAGDASSVVVRLDGVEAKVQHRQEGLSLVQIPADQPLGLAQLETLERTWHVSTHRRVLEIVEPWFERVEVQTGLQFEHDVSGWSERCAQALTGVGFADVDGDGDLDALVGNLGAPSVFFRNQGDGNGDGLPEFVEATDEVGLEGIDLVATLNFADFDNDGDPDLFVGRRAENRLFRNEGGVFTDVSASLGLPTYEQRTMGGGWGDWDNDGDLDLFVSNHAWCFPNQNQAVDQRNADRFYRNDGDRFTEQGDVFADDLGQMSNRFGFVSLWLDYDRDADQDLFVINDFVPNGGRSLVWENQGQDLGFAMVEVGGSVGFGPVPDAGNKVPNLMGVDVGDLNGDGLPDFAYSNIGHNGLVLSEETAAGVQWADGAEEGGVWREELPWYERSVTWATHLFDVDNDGDLDVMYVGGDLRGRAAQPHAFFENDGENRFVDRTWHAGLESHEHGKASALLDLDGDGGLEMVVANWSGRLEVYRNQVAGRGQDAHWIQVTLQGDGIAVNRDAFGAIVEVVEADASVQTCFRNPRPSLSATGDPVCHFGLGASSEPVEIRAIWPNGEVTEWADVQPNQRVEMTY
jgi:enediyne biosynthesis protein E4